MDTGAPMPNLLLHDDGLYVGYMTRFDGSSDDLTFAVVLFTGVLQHTFGYPNDEALGGHPLYSTGLSHYAFNEVANSPGAEQLVARNERVFATSRSIHLRRKHWIVTFHDETLEVFGSAVQLVGTTTAQSALEAIAKLRGCAGA